LANGLTDRVGVDAVARNHDPFRMQVDLDPRDAANVANPTRNRLDSVSVDHLRNLEAKFCHIVPFSRPGPHGRVATFLDWLEGSTKVLTIHCWMPDKVPWARVDANMSL
jgi:hypothetical protein